MAGVEVPRSAAQDRPAHGVALVDFADEEGARFGRSLFGSSAVAGTLDAAAVADLRDAEVRRCARWWPSTASTSTTVGAASAPRRPPRPPPRAAHRAGPGARARGRARGRRERHGRGRAAPLHVHRAGVARRHHPDAAAPDAGLARPRPRSPSKTPPAGTAASARPVLRLEPGIPRPSPAGPSSWPTCATPRPGPWPRCSPTFGRRRATRRRAGRRCAAGSHEVWRIEPIPFDERLVAAALEAAGTGRVLASGALHDAAEMARRVPAAMMFILHRRPQPHQGGEHARAGLERGIAAFGELALGVAAGEAGLSQSPTAASIARAPLGGEVLARELGRRPRVARVVGLDRLDRRDRLVERGEGQQASPPAARCRTRCPATAAAPPPGSRPSGH